MFYVPGLMLKDGEFLSPAGVQFRTVKLGGDAFLELSQRKETPAGSYLYRYCMRSIIFRLTFAKIAGKID